MLNLLQQLLRLAGASAKHDTLYDLDDDALRDIGVRRCEISSIEAETPFEATRLRIVSRQSS